MSRGLGTSSEAFSDVQAGSRRGTLPLDVSILPQNERKAQGTGEKGRCFVHCELLARNRRKNNQGRSDRRVAQPDDQGLAHHVSCLFGLFDSLTDPEWTVVAPVSKPCGLHTQPNSSDDLPQDQRVGHGIWNPLSAHVSLHCRVRTKPLARQTLRVLVGRGVLFDRLHSRWRTGILLGDAPHLECSQ